MQALVDAIFGALAGDVPFAFACLATTDPISGLINAAYKSGALPVGEEDFAAAEYGAPDLNKFAELAQRPVPVGVLSVDTDGHPERCRRLRDYMTPQFGFSDELRLVCRGQTTTWALLALYRGRDEPPFTVAEGRLVATVHEVIADAVRRVLYADNPTASTANDAPVVLIVDAGDHVVDMSSGTEDVIEELGGWDHGSLPASVLFVAVSARTAGHPVEARIPVAAGGWLRARAVPLTGTVPERPVVLTIEQADPATVGQMTIAARGLTAREQEVVALILQGASTKEVAAGLHLSPHTVQDHLKSVFDKLGVSSRRELIGQFVLT